MSRKLLVVDRLDQLADEELLARTAAGSADAFAVFYERNAPLVLAFLYRRTGSLELTADLVAETFAAALIACRRFRCGGPSAVSWLLGIAQNKLRETARRHRIERRARERLGLPALAVDDEDLERVQRTAQDAFALLDGLPVAQRDAVLRHVVEEQDYREIAEQLNCSQALARQNVSRGLRRLRAQLKESP